MAKQQDQRAKLPEAQGVLPVGIEILIAGEIHRFEKFVTDEDVPQATPVFSRKAA